MKEKSEISHQNEFLEKLIEKEREVYYPFIYSFF
jgi:hypothetical protein